MHLTELELVSLAHLYMISVPDVGMVRREDTRILIGPDASPDEIATVACRRLVELRDGKATDRAVRAEVKARGFRYAPRPKTITRLTKRAVRRAG